MRKPCVALPGVVEPYAEAPEPHCGEGAPLAGAALMPTP
jgi:hypothetical protein